MSLAALILSFLFTTVIKQSSSQFDLWKKLNRGGAPTDIATNDIALYLIDGQNQLKAIDSGGSTKSIASGVSRVDVDDDYGVMIVETSEVMKSRTGVSVSNAIGTGWDTIAGAGIGIATGRHGILLHWNSHTSYIATGITSSNRKGTAWSEIATGMKKIRCGRRHCFSLTKSHELYSSGAIPAGYSPTLLDPKLVWAKIGNNVKDLSAYSTKTLWQLDSNGTVWKAVNVFGSHFIKFTWERQSYQGLEFTKIAVTNKLQYAISNDTHIRVLTGCPIFDFEDNDLSHWTKTGTAFSKQPVVSQETFYGRPSGKVGDRTIDTLSARTSYGMAENANASTQTNTPVGTLKSPLFQIRTEMLHFVIGGGSSPNNYAGLYIDGVERFLASGESADKENPDGAVRAGRYWWDVSSYINKCAYIKIVDSGTASFGNTLFDDLCASPPCYKGMTVGLESVGHDGNVTIGQEIKYRLDLKGFYTSKTRPLSITVSFPITDGEPFLYVKDISVKSHKCATSADKTYKKKSIRPGSRRVYSNRVTYKNYLLSDSVIEVLARVYDHTVIKKQSVKSIHGSVKINFADEYLQTINHNIKVARHGNETAGVICTENVTNAEYFYVGDNVTYNVELNLNSSSPQRAFNVTIRLFLPPYLTLLTVQGLQSAYGDSLSSPSQSQSVVNIQELLFEDTKKISFIMQISIDYAWDKLHSKEIPGIFLVDAISFCNNKHCKNVHGNSTEIVTVIKNKQYHFTIKQKDERPARKYTEINAANGTIVITCGSYEAHGREGNGRCYYGNSSTGIWYNLPSIITHVTYYDETSSKIFGRLHNLEKVELYGEMFREYKILTDSEWEAVVARGQSLAASQSVHDPARSVRKNSNGNLSYERECCLDKK